MIIGAIKGRGDSCKGDKETEDAEEERKGSWTRFTNTHRHNSGGGGDVNGNGYWSIILTRSSDTNLRVALTGR